MNNNLSFKSHINIYWYAYLFIVFLIVAVNLVFIRELKNFSFEFYFLMMIPLWIGCLSINNFETERLKKIVRSYLESTYPKKLEAFDEKPVNLLDSETEDILDLFKDPELLNDANIGLLKNEARKITLFMYSVFISMPIVLVSVVFLILH